ncbi:hypothetical protein TTRE_0000514201 [Trichuris trichiura]|uniref:EGF-like domain-containing protein n=1 Tax=Trichuris trichiura TaxID=36087 RepID=A0A077ZAL8_TRITR|nr:hypothetical protein TTRE_0000514201 [Trichuris trichiura]
MTASQSLLLKLLVADLLLAVSLINAELGKLNHNQTTCPFEPIFGKSRDLYGFERTGSCYTLVKRLDKDGRQTNAEKLNHTCHIMFKNGRLFYLDQSSLPEKLNWRPEEPTLRILNSTSENNWDAYLCVHEKYKNCIVARKVECIYLEELHGCYWQESVRIYQHAESPYGRACLNATEWTRTDDKCVCTNCMDTKWAHWNAYTDQRGLQVRTRYRPFSHNPTWPCTFDSSKCCHEVDTSNLGVGDPESLARRVSCAGGGTRQVRSDGWACECPIGLTGMYCEIG